MPVGVAPRFDVARAPGSGAFALELALATAVIVMTGVLTELPHQ